MTEAQLLADRLRYLSQHHVGLKESQEIVDSLPRIVAMLDLVPNGQGKQGMTDAWRVAVDLTEKSILSEYYSGRLNGDHRIKEVFKSLRAALVAAQPRYFTDCPRDGVCRGVCETTDCPNYDLVVAARVCVEPQKEGILYPDKPT